MSLIFSPLSEDILEGPFQPYPRGAFIMLQDNEGTPIVDKEMDTVVSEYLLTSNFTPLKATSKRASKDFLEKIVQMIRGCGFGVAIFSEFTNSTSLANIFFEIGLCNMFGKPVLIIKSEKAKAPSDFVRTEWVSYSYNNEKLKADFKKSVSDVLGLAKYFENLGDIAFEAEERDLELAFERYKQAILINGDENLKKKVIRLLNEIKISGKNKVELEASRKRLQSAVLEFSKFIS